MDEFDEEGDELLLAVADPLMEEKSGLALPEGNSPARFKDSGNGSRQDPQLNNRESNGRNGTSDVETPVPTDFPFPFKPYDKQVGFMRHLYTCLRDGKIGIFESPTGTGKSLSLICGALKWLADFREQQQEELRKVEEENQRLQDDWIAQFSHRKAKEEQLTRVKAEQSQLLQRETRLKETKQSMGPSLPKKRRILADDEFDELFKGASGDLKKAYKAEVSKMDSMSASEDAGKEDEDFILDEQPDREEEEEKAHEEEEDHITKIFYCSRTHSQLAQFVREVMKSPYGETTRVITLGSRQNLCINDSVRKLKSLSLMNDRCLELQEKKQKKKSSTAGCPFRKQHLMEDFRDQALVEVQDIEDLVSSARATKACPYYGTRMAVPLADVVVLPYNTLLHQSTREASGIKIKDNIIVIDEAHNLLETINSIHSVEVTGSHIVRAHSQLSQYLERYQSRLRADNLMYVKQMLQVLGGLARGLGGRTDTPPEKQVLGQPRTTLLSINSFLFQAQLDNLNLFHLLQFCQRSQISKKLLGFVEKYQAGEVKIQPSEPQRLGVSKFLQEIQQQKGPKNKSEAITAAEEKTEVQRAVFHSPLMMIEELLASLTNADKDGRIVVNVQNTLDKSSLKFLMLNPAVHFARIVQDARAVVVAGGTMQPVSEFKDQLLASAGVGAERVMEYSCGHVIPPTHLLPLTVACGPTGSEFNFTFTQRGSPKMLEELGRLICNVCNVVPGGIVVFFPSYDYEKLVYGHWEKSGLLQRIAAKKAVFREPKGTGQTESVLTSYGDCIRLCQSGASSGQTGAILFSVVGGKMSEGINFSDDLGRCVIMVGMPYPNLTSPELKEKMSYLDTHFPRGGDGQTAGQQHYENLCMKAVNQSIGRAIRHQGDYACILLVDVRYSRPAVLRKLPQWIASHVMKCTNFGAVVSKITAFFASKK